MLARSLVRSAGLLLSALLAVAVLAGGQTAEAQVTAKTLISKAVSDDSQYK